MYKQLVHSTAVTFCPPQNVCIGSVRRMIRAARLCITLLTPVLAGAKGNRRPISLLRTCTCRDTRDRSFTHSFLVDGGLPFRRHNMDKFSRTLAEHRPSEDLLEIQLLRKIHRTWAKCKRQALEAPLPKQKNTLTAQNVGKPALFVILHVPKGAQLVGL